MNTRLGECAVINWCQRNPTVAQELYSKNVYVYIYTLQNVKIYISKGLVTSFVSQLYITILPTGLHIRIRFSRYSKKLIFAGGFKKREKKRGEKSDGGWGGGGERKLRMSSH